MIISFIRHGESEANVLRLLSSRADEPYKLTEKGINQIKKTSSDISGNVKAIYSSPLPRTIQSSEIILNNLSNKPDLIVDDRITEINYGKYSGKLNNEELDEVRKEQVAGNYESRFGVFGENKREIVTRICNFLIDIVDHYGESDHVVVVSHGTIITLIELTISQFKDLKSDHVHTNNASIKEIVLCQNDREAIKEIIDEMKDRKKKEEHKRVGLVKTKFKYFPDINKDLQDRLLQNYIKIAQEGVDNIELSSSTLDLLTDGFYKSDIKPLQKKIDISHLNNNDVIIVCAYKNAKKLIRLFIDHHKKIGISNFVFIDNNSTDGSNDIIKKYANNTNIDIWHTEDKFDGFKSCGWRQRIMAIYGTNRWYLDLDIDELFVYNGIEKDGINGIIGYARKNGLQTIGSIMLDVYSDKPILSIKRVSHSSIQKLYKYIDRDTYLKKEDINYKYRVFGGPRHRKFCISPSLQKLPLIFVKDDTLNVNPHFWYPFSVNYSSNMVSALLHYKFLPGDFKLYKDYAKTGVHWDNSKEYKIYVNVIKNDPTISFFDDNHSMEYKNSESLGKIQIIDHPMV